MLKQMIVMIGVLILWASLLGSFVCLQKQSKNQLNDVYNLIEIANENK